MSVLGSMAAISRTCIRAPRLATARQSGAALIVCLLMLVVVLMLGTSAAHIALQEEKASRIKRDRQLALESAEAALVDAEQDIESSQRRHVFSSRNADAFSQECGEGAETQHLGLCLPEIAGGVPVWQRVNLASREGGSVAVPFGYFTGRALQTGDGLLPAALPRYIIEPIAFNKRKDQSGREEPVYLYRITALGFGLRDTTTVVLQTFYGKVNGESPDLPLPKGRLSWREIPNWEELYDASKKR